MEVYAGYMVIKSKTEEGLLSDVEETFAQLRRINMKLNLKMCTFGIEKTQPKKKQTTNRRARNSSPGLTAKQAQNGSK